MPHIKVTTLILGALGFGLAAPLGGCVMGPDFEPPAAMTPPPDFGAPVPAAAPPSATVEQPIDPAWWAGFKDPILTALEARVAEANLDVQAATIRLAESRAQRQITGAEELPTLGADASYIREKPSPKGEFSLLSGGASSGPASAGVANPGLALKPFNIWQSGFDASWELDLWGRVRRSIEAADANFTASEEARRDTLISIQAEIARDYVQLRGTQTQLGISRTNLDIAQETLKLTQARAQGGLTTQLDVANAAAQLAGTAALIPQLEQQQSQTINQLSFLLGEAPGTLAAELTVPRPVPPVPPVVPVGLPSELAHRRPDIRQAEAQLHVQTAEIGVAEANFYPSITLNGSLDLQALKFNDLGNWAARTYTFGPSLSLPIFEGGKLTGNLELTKAEQQGAAIAYRRAVLNAWAEVSNALTAYEAEQRRQARLVEAVAQNRQALDLARRQYAQGLVDFLSVLTAQQQLLSNEQQSAISLTTMSTNLVALYKALGGGWETAFPVGKTVASAQ